MKVLIEIPEAFISHFQMDRFKDSLQRLEADVHKLAGRYERELADMLVDAFANAEEV